MYTTGPNSGLQASLSGERVLFYSTHGYPGGGGSGLYFLAKRTEGGWFTENPVPPQSVMNSTVAVGCANAYFPLATPELSNWVLADGYRHGDETYPGAVENEKEKGAYCPTDEPRLVAGEPEDRQNLFLHDPGAGVEPGPWQLIDSTSQAPAGEHPSDAWAQGASEDLSRIVFTEAARLTADAPPITVYETQGYKHRTEDVYEFSEGTVRLLTVKPDGEAVPGVPASKGIGTGDSSLERSAPYTHPVSSDGQRVAFEAEGSLYVRENPMQPPEHECSSAQAACTVQVDAAQGGGSESGGGHFQWASSDGSRVLFSDERDLVAGAHASAGEPDLYEYDFNAPEGQRLIDLTAHAGEAGDVQGVAGMSEDGQVAYFVAGGDLTGTQQNSQGSSAIVPARGTGELKGGGEGTGTQTPGSHEITNLKVTSGEFFVGQEINREDGANAFPGGTTVSGCSPSCSAPSELTLSNPSNAGASSSEPFVGYGHDQITAVSTSSGGFEVGMPISGSGIRAGSTIVAIGAGTITLSQPVATSASGTQALLAVSENLYMHRGEETVFIATLSPRDALDWESPPLSLTSRTSADGQYLAFNAIDPLTGYDNEGHEEIYLYDAAAGTLSCASCAPDGQPPTGPAYIEAPGQTAENDGAPLYPQRVVSDSGQVFFNTVTPLLPAAKNGLWNVYEYTNGNLYLLSNGSGDANSYFEEASANGENVFILTSELLSDHDGALEVFDVRVDGGFPEPVQPHICGEGECATATPPPSTSTAPDSATFTGPGDMTPAQSVLAVKVAAKKTLTRAQKLTSALTACRHKYRHSKHKRDSCEANAHKRYAARKATSDSKHPRPGG